LIPTNDMQIAANHLLVSTNDQFESWWTNYIIL
jgi:hypothetical protein